MVDIDQAVNLKKQIKKLEQEKERATGRVEQLMKTIQEEFNCNTLEEAEQLLKEKQKKKKELEEKYETEHEKFMEKWGDKLV